jgi:hypothetical protein
VLPKEGSEKEDAAGKTCDEKEKILPKGLVRGNEVKGGSSL